MPAIEAFQFSLEINSVRFETGKNLLLVRDLSKQVQSQRPLYGLRLERPFLPISARFFVLRAGGDKTAKEAGLPDD
jgi:hypothetical protein